MIQTVNPGDAIKAKTINDIIAAISTQNVSNNVLAGAANISSYNNGIEREQFDVLHTVEEDGWDDNSYIEFIYSGGTYYHNGELKTTTESTYQLQATARDTPYVILNLETGDITTGAAAALDDENIALGKFEIIVENKLLTYKAYMHQVSVSSGANFSFNPSNYKTYGFSPGGYPIDIVNNIYVTGGLINYSGQFIAKVEDPPKPIIEEKSNDLDRWVEITNREESRVVEANDGDYIIIKTQYDGTGVSYNVVASAELPYPSVTATYNPALQ